MVMGIFYGCFQVFLFGYEFEYCFVNFMNFILFGGVFLKFGLLFEEVLDSVDVFFCCFICGKVFWEGGYYKRIFIQFFYFLDSLFYFF